MLRLSYFSDFKVLMQRVKAASGLPELAALPNTVAGFGRAYLKLRQSVGASNAVLGLRVSVWATGKDIASYNVTDPLQPEVDEGYAFLSPLGLTSNVTGAQYDVLVGDPLDRDADYYRVVQGQDRTWDPSDSASISSRSFNRYAEWLRLWNVKAAKRWVLWQIPLGNSNSKNLYNNGGPAEGYKDNRPEYFFGSGASHIAKFAESGVIALLFGQGAAGQSSPERHLQRRAIVHAKPRRRRLERRRSALVHRQHDAPITDAADAAADDHRDAAAYLGVRSRVRDWDWPQRGVLQRHGSQRFIAHSARTPM